MSKTTPPGGARAPVVLLNGRIVPADELGLPWNAPGLRQGFGLFETVRVASGRAFLGGHHAQRLTDAAGELGIEPWMHPRTLGRGMDRLIAVSGIRDGAMRVFLLPGAPPPGEESSDDFRYPEEAASSPFFRARPRARYVGTLHDHPAPRPSSVRAVLSPDLRDPNGPLVGLKTISYAAERLLLARARAQGADEALRRNLDGRLGEGTRSNLFLFEGDRLVTPPLSEGLLAGITRWFLIRIAPENGFTPAEEPVPVDRLLGADEAFLASTLRGVVPLVALDGKPIGAGEPGPRATRLREVLERHIVRS